MKLDIKNIAILVLGFLLILSFLFNKNKSIGSETEIKILNESNQSLLIENNKLNKVIDTLNVSLNETKKLLIANNKKVKELQLEIQKLKDEKSKIPNTVKRMSANVVAITFSKYLDKR